MTGLCETSSHHLEFVTDIDVADCTNYWVGFEQPFQLYTNGLLTRLQNKMGRSGGFLGWYSALQNRLDIYLFYLL